MTFNELLATGMFDLEKGDQVEIVAPDGAVVAGPLTVQMALCDIGDWLYLTNDTYLEGNMCGGEQPADISHLPTGWRFKKLTHIQCVFAARL